MCDEKEACGEEEVVEVRHKWLVPACMVLGLLIVPDGSMIIDAVRLLAVLVLAGGFFVVNWRRYF